MVDSQQPRKRRVPKGFFVIAFGWCVITAYAIWAGEHVPKTEHTQALKEISQRIEASKGSLPDKKPISDSDSAKIAKTLGELQQLAASNLRIREDAERTANWAELTLKLIGGISLLVLGASALGGYSLLTSAKDQATLLGQASAITQGVERDLAIKTKAMQDLVEMVEKERVDLLEKTSEIEERQASLTDAYVRMNMLLQEIERKAAMTAQGVTSAYAKFDFTKLDAAAESILPKGPSRLPAEERARLEDYDVQIQLGEILGADAEADVYFKLGRYYRFAGNYARALVRLDKATQRDPGNFAAWLEKTVCYVGIARSDLEVEGKRELLDKAFSDGLDKARPLAESTLQKFQLHFLDGWLLDEVLRYPEAIAAYEESRRYMADERIDYNIACSLSKEGRLPEAFARLEAIRDANLIAYAAEDEDFESLRNDATFGPRLLELIRRAGGASGQGVA